MVREILAGEELPPPSPRGKPAGRSGSHFPFAAGSAGLAAKLRYELSFPKLTRGAPLCARVSSNRSILKSDWS